MIVNRERTSMWAATGLVLAIAASLAACADPPGPGSESTATLALASPLNPPTEVPTVCPQRAAYCVFKPAQGSDADTSKYPLWSSLGCGPIYDFETGPSFGLGALCPNSSKNRGLLHAHGMAGFVPVSCTPVPPGELPCLNLPPELLFAVFEPKDPDPSPFCPSTCLDMLSPLAF